VDVEVRGVVCRRPWVAPCFSEGDHHHGGPAQERWLRVALIFLAFLLSCHRMVFATSVRRWICLSYSDGSTGFGSQGRATSDGVSLQVGLTHASYVKRLTELVPAKPAPCPLLPGVQSSGHVRVIALIRSV